MSKALVSVIVPVYNVREYLEECWNSIVKQTYDNIEIILVDDGSTDESGKMCDEFAKEEARVIVIHRENGGLSAARNSGLDVCNGEYITFVDSDDVIAPNMVSAMVSVMDETKADIVQCEGGRFADEADILKIQNCGQEGIEVFRGKDFVGDVDFKDMACGKLYRHTIWCNVRFREGIIHEDFALIYRLFYEASLVARVGQPFYFARKRVGSIMQLGFRRESLILIELSEERIDFFRGKNEKELLDKAYISYYGYLLTFYNQMLRSAYFEREEKVCVCNSLLRKYRSNILCFLSIKSIKLKSKLKLASCFFVPRLWKC